MIAYNYNGLHVIDLAYPGQSQAVRVALGITAVAVCADGYVHNLSLGWRDRPHPRETMSWEAFAAKYRGNPIVDAEDEDRRRRLHGKS